MKKNSMNGSIGVRDVLMIQTELLRIYPGQIRYELSEPRGRGGVARITVLWNARSAERALMGADGGKVLSAELAMNIPANENGWATLYRAYWEMGAKLGELHGDGVPDHLW